MKIDTHQKFFLHIFWKRRDSAGGNEGNGKGRERKEEKGRKFHQEGHRRAPASLRGTLRGSVCTSRAADTLGHARAPVQSTSGERNGLPRALALACILLPQGL